MDRANGQEQPRDQGDRQRKVSHKIHSSRSVSAALAILFASSR
jgi:hypothetical protein